MTNPTALFNRAGVVDTWPTAATLVAGIIGDPIRHSLSPVLHNAAYREMGLDWAYVAFVVAAGDSPNALAAMRALGLVGLTVTMPHKDGAALAADQRSETADRLQSANTLHWLGGEQPWHGNEIGAESTDGPGLIQALEASGISASGKQCVVLGTGGASRAAIAALGEWGAAEVIVLSRNSERANQAGKLAGRSGRAGTTSDIATSDLVINGTPVGMHGVGTGARHGLPLDPTLLSATQTVIDMIYNPAETPLLLAAREKGARIMNGLPMLVFQAALQVELWSGMEAPRDVMLASVGLDPKSLVL